MATEEFRREIRTDPATKRKVIVLPDFKGDVYSWMTTPLGEEIDIIPVNGSNFSALTPETPLFFLEDGVESVGDGIVYDRSSAFGADERFFTEVFNVGGLEALLKSFQSRAVVLKTKAINRDSLSQFYPYVVYDVERKSLTGILLASRAIAPTIHSEIENFDRHSEFHSEIPIVRCMYCDIKDEERKRADDKESRFVAQNGDYIAFTPFAAPDQHQVDIVPFQHIPRFTELSEEQIRNLAAIVYDAVRRIQIVAKQGRRFFDVINMSLHSAPYIINDGKMDPKTKFPLEKIYHFHVEVSPGQNPLHGAPYVIPFSGWPIRAERPKDVAYNLRQALNHHP